MINFERFIFLPGASGSTEFWSPLIHHLSQDSNLKDHPVRVVAYPEFNGQAAHSKVNNFQSLQTYVLDQITVPSVIVAQSMGGIFAVQAALEKPNLVSTLVLIATSGGIDLSPFDVADWREDYQKQFSVPSWFVDHQQILDDQLNQIQCPILLIWGDDDAISPVAVGQYLQSRFRKSQLHIIQQGKHDLANVHAAEVGVLIAKFIRQNS